MAMSRMFLHEISDAVAPLRHFCRSRRRFETRSAEWDSPHTLHVRTAVAPHVPGSRALQSKPAVESVCGFNLGKAVASSVLALALCIVQASDSTPFAAPLARASGTVRARAGDSGGTRSGLRVARRVASPPGA
jgi:hypothetical protein